MSDTVMAPQTEKLIKLGHLIDVALWDDRGTDDHSGWQIWCRCGWMSNPQRRMQDAGEEFDEHLAIQGF